MLRTQGRFRAAYIRNGPVESSCRHQSLAAEACGDFDRCARASRLIGGRLGNVARMLFVVNIIGQALAPASAPQDFGVTPITEEHGFSQTVRDVDLLAFSDDSPFELGVTPPPHHREDRHY